MDDVFIKAKVVTVKHLALLAGPELDNLDAVARGLGVHSFWKVGQILQSFRDSITEEEKMWLKNWTKGCEIPDCADHCPSMGTRPKMDEEDFQV